MQKGGGRSVEQRSQSLPAGSVFPSLNACKENIGNYIHVVFILGKMLMELHLTILLPILTFTVQIQLLLCHHHGELLPSTPQRRQCV